MTTSKIKAAEALAPMLDAFHLIGDKPLQAVWQDWTEGCLERLVLDFDSTRARSSSRVANILNFPSPDKA